MERMKRAALLSKLVEELRLHGSWCGETHIQKATLFLQELTSVPLDMDFILYKHGPFSFDLRDELTSMRADELLELEPQWPYGPRVLPTERSQHLQKLYAKTVARYEPAISFVATRLGDKGVSELERVATAYFLTINGGSDESAEVRARCLVKAKPHVRSEDALTAVREADEIIAEWAAI